LTFTFHPLPGLPCWADLYIFSHVGSYRRRNHTHQISTPLVKELGGNGSPKSGVSHWLWMSLLQQCYARRCYTVTMAVTQEILNIDTSCLSLC